MNQTGVRHEILFREDIRNLLRSIDAANASLTIHLPTSEIAIYRAGFIAALQAVALAFDIPLEVRPPRPTLGPLLIPDVLPEGE